MEPASTLSIRVARMTKPWANVKPRKPSFKHQQPDNLVICRTGHRLGRPVLALSLMASLGLGGCLLFAGDIRHAPGCIRVIRVMVRVRLTLRRRRAPCFSGRATHITHEGTCIRAQ
jgi:hypothetical protein